MLPKSKRLNLKYDFNWVSKGQRVEAGMVKLFYRMGDNAFPKIGISLSSKNFPRAVERNRARRLISAAIEKLYPKLPSGLNLMALPKDQVLEISSPQLAVLLEKILKQEKII